MDTATPPTPAPLYSKRQEKFYFRLLVALVQGVFWLIINCYFRFTRLRHVDAGGLATMRSGAPVMFAAWHGDMYYCSWIVNKWDMDVMASRSNSGSLAAAMLRASGNRPVRGSSSRGGMEALGAMVETMKSGRRAAIIADAPRGPAHVSKLGPALGAARSGCPILPAALCAQRRWQFPGWDRGWIPRPFARTVVVWGEPMHVPPGLGNEEMEAIRVQLTDRLNALARRAEEECGEG